MVGNDSAETERMAAVLKRTGYALSFDTADQLEAFRERLLHCEYDVVICDHAFGASTALEALEVLRETQKDVPFIVVTTVLGDEAAVDYIKAGAADYVLKHRIERMPVAVGQALRERATRDEVARLRGVIAAGKREWERTFDSVPDPVLLLDHEGRVRRANRAAIETLQKTFAQVIGRPCHEVLHGQDHPCAGCPHAEALECGQLRRGDILNARADKIFDAACTPLRDSSGQLSGFVVVLRDVTERRRAEEALRNSEAQYRLLFEDNPQPMWVFDRVSLAFLAVNDAAVAHYGYSREEFLQMNLKDIRPPQDARPLLDHLAESRSGIQMAGEWRHRRKDGSILDVIITQHPITFAGKSAMLGLAADITDRKILEQQLLQGQKMEGIGRLAAGIAHDFNNLLTVISGRCALLCDKLEPGGRMRNSVEEIMKAADRAAALTRQLLAFSRQQILQPQILDLNVIVAGMGKLLRRLLREDIELVTICGNELGRIKTDPSQIEQVIMNLAVNARDAMPQGGKLTLETSNVNLDPAYAETRYHVSSGPYILLAVSDTGIGMDEATKPHIFEPFFTTKERGKGTGLGLATVYGIVKQSGGYIWVYSEPGHGATFKIYFPRADDPAVVIADSARQRHIFSRGKETVLVVEDEPSLRSIVVEILQSSGYHVLEASNGADALDVASKEGHAIHLLMTDIVMPGIGGRELAERLSVLYPKMKILFTSGYTDDVVIRHAMLGAGAVFLQKPFSPETVSRKVREVLDAG